jgi:hypothetical protein
MIVVCEVAQKAPRAILAVGEGARRSIAERD